MHHYGTPAIDDQVLVQAAMTNGSIVGSPPSSGWEQSETAATALGYIETFDPETAARNFTSILEYMDRIAEGAVLNDAGEYKENLIIEMDGAHCSREESARFCAGLVFDLLDLNCLHCVTGGQSKFNKAEQVNGSLARRVNGTILHVDPVEVQAD